MDADETDTQGALLNLRDPATATALGLHLPRTLYRRVEDGARAGRRGLFCEMRLDRQNRIYTWRRRPPVSFRGARP